MTLGTIDVGRVRDRIDNPRLWPWWAHVTARVIQPEGVDQTRSATLEILSGD